MSLGSNARGDLVHLFLETDKYKRLVWRVSKQKETQILLCTCMSSAVGRLQFVEQCPDIFAGELNRLIGVLT